MTERLLIIDDDKDSLLLLKLVLEEAGYEDLILTSDPFQALGLFDPARPDLVMVDLHMPGLSGFTLIGELRNRIGGGAVPIVVLTADTSGRRRNEHCALGLPTSSPSPTTALRSCSASRIS